MIHLKRTDASDIDFINLVTALDKDLAERDGDDHPFYAQYNKINVIKHAVVAYDASTPVGCGAVKEYEPGVMEVKRMYVPPHRRGERIAARVLTELEHWAGEMGYNTCILETGNKQPEAITLYRRCGYRQIPNFGQYAGVDNSLCFRKELKAPPQPL